MNRSKHGERRPVEDLAGLVGVQAVEFPGVPIVSARVPGRLTRSERFLKRTVDVVGSAIALTVSAPVIFVLAIAVKLADAGPAFFAHPREGRGGERFDLWKIRSMRLGSEALLDEHLRANPEARRVWLRRFKLDEDPRVLPGLGAFMRRFSLDELPQFWNVLIGEMSLVGPRPLPDYHLRKLPDEFRRLRCCVRPGLTGSWQVHVRSSGDVEELQRYDLGYLRNWSLVLDLKILMATVRATLSGKGAL